MWLWTPVDGAQSERRRRHLRLHMPSVHILLCSHAWEHQLPLRLPSQPTTTGLRMANYTLKYVVFGPHTREFNNTK
jgi:hypothetical protein